MKMKAIWLLLMMISLLKLERVIRRTEDTWSSAQLRKLTHFCTFVPYVCCENDGYNLAQCFYCPTSCTMASELQTVNCANNCKTNIIPVDCANLLTTRVNSGSFSNAAQNVGSITHDYKSLIFGDAASFCPLHNMYGGCTISYSSGVNNLAQMTMDAQGITTIDLANSVIGIGVYTITCILTDTKLYSPPLATTISNSLITQEIYDVCTYTTISPQATAKSYLYEVNQDNGTPLLWAVTAEPLSGFYNIQNNTQGCKFTACQITYPCGTAYSQINSQILNPVAQTLDLVWKTDIAQGPSLSICLACQDNNKVPGTRLSNLLFEVKNDCATRITFNPNPVSSVTNRYTSNPAIDLTGDPAKYVFGSTHVSSNNVTLCPIIQSSLVYSDGSPFTGVPIKIDPVTKQVVFSGVLGVTNQAVKMRVTTTAPVVLETALFNVGVYNCSTFITQPTINALYSQLTGNYAALSGTQLFGPFVSSDTVNCPITSAQLMQMQMPGPVPYSGSCVSIDPADPSTGFVAYQGVICPKETNLFVRVQSQGGAIIDSAKFDVEVIINCTTHLQVSAFASQPFDRTVPFSTNVSGQVMESQAIFVTTEPTHCPRTNVAILDASNNPYTGSCINVDPGSFNVQYGGIFCQETGLKFQITATTPAGVVWTHTDTQTFSVKVEVNCTPHFRFPVISTSTYLRLAVTPSEAANEAYIPTWAPTTADPINCPISAVSLVDATGLILYPGNCTKVDPSPKVMYKGEDFCKDTGIKIKLTTTGGIGYTALSNAFDVTLKCNCLPNLGVPTTNPLYYRFVPFSTNVSGEIIISGGDFSSVYPQFCPLTAPDATYTLLYGTSPEVAYTGTCVTVDAQGNVRFAGVFCPLETNIVLKLESKGVQDGEIFTKYTNPFDAEVRVNCTPHLVPQVFLELYEQIVTDAIDLWNKEIRSSSIVSIDPVNCPLSQFYILKAGTLYLGNCIKVDTTGLVTYNGLFCEEADFKIKVTTVHSQTAETSAFNVSVKPNCSSNLESHALESHYSGFTSDAANYSNFKENLILNGSKHFISRIPDLCPILSYELWLGGAVYTGDCVVLSDNISGILEFNGKFCAEYDLTVRMNSKESYFAFSKAFNVELTVDCTPQIMSYEIDSYFLRVVPNKRELKDKLMLPGSKIGWSKLTHDCPLNFFRLRQYNEWYDEKNTTCIEIQDQTKGDIKFTGEYCKEYNISVVFGTTYANTAFNKTGFFDVETQELEKVKPKDVNKGPWFNGPIPSLGIVFDENKQTEENSLKLTYTIELPEIADDKGEVKSLEILSRKFGNMIFENKSLTANVPMKQVSSTSKLMTFDPVSRLLTLAFQNSKQLYKFEGENQLQFKLQDKDGTISYYSTGVVIMITRKKEVKKDIGDELKKIDNGPFVTAKIKKINQFGEMTIKFNTAMRTINPNITLSDINDTIVDIYIVPQGNWHLTKPLFRMEWLNFTWNVTEYKGDELKIKMNFFHPIQISPVIPLDRLVFHIKQKHYFFFSQKYRKDLHDNYTTLDYGIKKQLEDSEFSRAFVEATQTTSAQLSWAFVGTSSMQIFVAQILQRILQLISSLSVVLHLPLNAIVFPVNVSYVFKVFLPIAQFDMLERMEVLHKFFPKSAQDALKHQNLLEYSSSLGYDTLNLWMNLGMITVLIWIYLLLLFFFVVCAQPRRNKTEFWHKLHRNLKHRVFFGLVISITLGGQFEILISVYLNIMSPAESIDRTLFLVIWSAVLGWIALVFVPCVTIHLMLLPLDILEKEKTRNKWGMYFLELDYRSPFKLFYQIVFQFRRITFVSIALLLKSHGGLQIILINLLNMVVFISFCLLRPLRGKFRNDLDMFNEFFIGVIHIICFCFSDFVDDQEHQLKMGWLMLGIIVMMLFVSFSFVLYDAARIIYLSLIRFQVPMLFHRYISGPFEYWWTPAKAATPGRTWLAPKTQFPQPIELKQVVQASQAKKSQKKKAQKAKKKVEAKSTKKVLNLSKGKVKSQSKGKQTKQTKPSKPLTQKVAKSPPSQGRRQPNHNNPYLKQNQHQYSIASQRDLKFAPENTHAARSFSLLESNQSLESAKIYKEQPPPLIQKDPPSQKMMQFEMFDPEAQKGQVIHDQGWNTQRQEAQMRQQQPTWRQPTRQQMPTMAVSQASGGSSPETTRYPSVRQQASFGNNSPPTIPVQSHLSKEPSQSLMQEPIVKPAPRPSQPRLDIAKKFQEQLDKDKEQYQLDKLKSALSDKPIQKLQMLPVPLMPPSLAPIMEPSPVFTTKAEQPQADSVVNIPPDMNQNLSNLFKLIDDSKARNKKRFTRVANQLSIINEDVSEQ